MCYGEMEKDPSPQKKGKKVCIYSCCVHLCQVGLLVKWGQNHET